MIWLDGALASADAIPLATDDAGLRFGVGLFETTRTLGGRPWLWQAHRARMIEAARRLGMPPLEDRLPDAAAVAAFLERFGPGDVVLRLCATAGGQSTPGRVWMTARPLPPLPPPESGASLQTARYRVSRSDPFAETKSLNYGLRWLAHREALAAGYEDALLLSTDGLVLEAAHASLFVRIGATWQTPALHGGILPGTLRQALLGQSSDPDADAIPRLAAVEVDLPIERLAEIDEAFLTNSVRGVVPVTQLDNRKLTPGAETQRLCALIAKA